MTDILVASFNPDDFISWPLDRKVDRYERVLRWHDRNSKLGPDKVPYSWGAYQIISQVNPSPVVHVLIAVYRVESIPEFDQLMLNDPLRDVSKYTTVLLDELEGDYQTDQQRFDESLKRLQAQAGAGNQEFDRIRSRYVSQPSFVGQYPFIKAPYPLRNYSAQPAALAGNKQELEFLIHGMNLEEDHGWDDATKAIHYEKVLWWHHYIAKMVNEGRITHVWGTHDFCDIGLFSYRSASGMAIYRAESLEDFADVYKQDPLRTRARFWSVALKPITMQRADDESILRRYRGQPL